MYMFPQALGKRSSLVSLSLAHLQTLQHGGCRASCRARGDARGRKGSCCDGGTWLWYCMSASTIQEMHLRETHRCIFRQTQRRGQSALLRPRQGLHLFRLSQAGAQDRLGVTARGTTARCTAAREVVETYAILAVSKPPPLLPHPQQLLRLRRLPHRPRSRRQWLLFCYANLSQIHVI